MRSVVQALITAIGKDQVTLSYVIEGGTVLTHTSRDKELVSECRLKISNDVMKATARDRAKYDSWYTAQDEHKISYEEIAGEPPSEAVNKATLYRALSDALRDRSIPTQDMIRWGLLGSLTPVPSKAPFLQLATFRVKAIPLLGTTQKHLINEKVPIEQYFKDVTRKEVADKVSLGGYSGGYSSYKDSAPDYDMEYPLCLVKLIVQPIPPDKVADKLRKAEEF